MENEGEGKGREGKGMGVETLLLTRKLNVNK